MCDTPSERFTGRVKWFNNKAGYGFITITDGQKSGTDVFVHHSSVTTGQEQYTYLVQGEYVEFELIPVQKEGFDVQATKVSGIKGGKLMCETRKDFRVARNTYKSSNTEDKQVEPSPPVKKQRVPKRTTTTTNTDKSNTDKSKPNKSYSKKTDTRNEKNADGSWTYVGKARQQPPASRKPPSK
jgi:cold shock protein